MKGAWMRRAVGAYLAVGLTLAGLDAVWLTQVGPRLYRPALDAVLADRPDMGAAVVFYLGYVLGVTALAAWPARSVASAALRGAGLGAMAYGTYDLTNQATLKVWSAWITLADVAWGASLTAVAATAGALALRRLAPRG